MLEKNNITQRYTSLFTEFNVNTKLRLSHFMGEAAHESDLKPIEENLRYSVVRLQVVFGKYFPTPIVAGFYAMNPQKIANKVYANRMGNGDEESGDGYRFRGRGFFQITGRNNYTALTKWAQNNGLNIDYVSNPDLLLNEADALIGALWFWSVNNLNFYADKDDIMSVAKIINLGSAKSNRTPNGMVDRVMQTNKYKSIFS